MTKMNTHSQLGDLEDPKLKKIAQRAAGVMTLAASRVAAHHADAKKFPLPAQPDSIETTLAAWFDTMRLGQKDFVAKQAVQQLTTPSVLQDRFGELSKIDLRVSASVSSQASSIPVPDLKFTAAEIAKLTAMARRGGLSPQLEHSNRLRLRVHEVYCGNETNSPWLDPHHGRDDMWLGGTMVDETGDTEKIHRPGDTKKAINLGKFNNKQRKPYPQPLEVAKFNLTEGTAFPKDYVVTLVLYENDDGDKAAGFLHDLLQDTKDEVQKAIRDAAGDVPIIGDIFGDVAADAYGLFVDWLALAWGDILFHPLTVKAHIEDYDMMWPDTNGKVSDNLTWETTAQEGRARYQLKYDWQLYESVAGICALTPNKNAISQYTGSGTSWRRIGEAASKLYGGGFGLLATNPTNGDLWRYLGAPNTWEKIGKSGAQFAVTNDAVYGLTPDKQAVVQYTGSGMSWRRIGGPASKLYGGGFGLVATNPNGDLYRYLGKPDKWERIGVAGDSFAVTSDAVYGLTPDKQAVVQYSGTGMSWTKIGGPASKLYGGDFGLVATRPPNGDLYRYLGAPDKWERIGGPGAQFAVGRDTVYGLTPDKTAVNRYTGSGTSWTQIGFRADSITAFEK
jgi:hypothetical protein